MDAETYYNNLPAEKKAELEEKGVTKEQFVKFCGAVLNAIKNVTPILAKIVKWAKSTCEQILETYPNKRVLHLAKYGKPRVRKKNRRRIMKWFEKQRDIGGDDDL